jgi:hypothetical protein
MVSKRELLLAGGIGSPTEDGRCGARPLKGGGPDLAAGVAVPPASRCLGACPQAALGDNRLHPGNARVGVDGIEPHASQDRADARDGAQTGEALGLVFLGGVDTRERESSCCHF